MNTNARLRCSPWAWLGAGVGEVGRWEKREGEPRGVLKKTGDARVVHGVRERESARRSASKHGIACERE